MIILLTAWVESHPFLKTQTLKNLKAVVEASGSSLSKVAKTTVCIVVTQLRIYRN